MPQTDCSEIFRFFFLIKNTIELKSDIQKLPRKLLLIDFFHSANQDRSQETKDVSDYLKTQVTFTYLATETDFLKLPVILYTKAKLNVNLSKYKTNLSMED